MEKLIFEIKEFFAVAFRFFFSLLENGQDCLVCSKKTYFFPVCKSCSQKYFSVENALSYARCSVCGKELVSAEKICLQCRKEPVLKNTDKVFPLFSYRLWYKEILFTWKIKGVRCLSSYFAALTAKALNLLCIKTVVPVPPRKGKIAEKGWDQIEELCTYLEKRYGFNVERILERRGCAQHKKMNRKKRLESIHADYYLKPGCKVLSEKVCLIDDVCTTGSTLESCAKILKQNGVKEVNALTLFSVD